MSEDASALPDPATAPLATVTPLHPAGDPDHHQRLHALPWAGCAPTPELFRHLARSSELLWRRVHLTGTFGRGAKEPAVTAWVGRPRGLRVVDVASGATVQHTPGCDEDSPVPLAVEGVGWARPEPHLGAYGLVDAPWPLNPRPTAPWFRDDRWWAVLFPHELADAADGATDPVRISHVQAVLQHGREAWQATVIPTATYAPRSARWPLVHHHDVSATSPLADPQPYTVRLDVETGLCVFVALVEPAGPMVPQDRCPFVDLVIHAVDDDVRCPAPDDVA